MILDKMTLYKMTLDKMTLDKMTLDLDRITNWQYLSRFINRDIWNHVSGKLKTETNRGQSNETFNSHNYYRVKISLHICHNHLLPPYPNICCQGLEPTIKAESCKELQYVRLLPCLQILGQGGLNGYGKRSSLLLLGTIFQRFLSRHLSDVLWRYFIHMWCCLMKQILESFSLCELSIFNKRLFECLLNIAFVNNRCTETPQY